MAWHEEYGRRFIPADEAARMVKCGHYAAFTTGRKAFACGFALAARKEELRNVSGLAFTPTCDFSWYDDGWQDSFAIAIGMPTTTSQEADNHRRCYFFVSAPIEQLQMERVPDVLLTEVSAPDDIGFCSFGSSVWDKKKQIQRVRAKGRPVIVEGT